MLHIYLAECIEASSVLVLGSTSSWKLVSGGETFIESLLWLTCHISDLVKYQVRPCLSQPPEKPMALTYDPPCRNGDLLRGNSQNCSLGYDVLCDTCFYKFMLGLTTSHCQFMNFPVGLKTFHSEMRCDHLAVAKSWLTAVCFVKDGLYWKSSKKPCFYKWGDSLRY